MSRTLVAYFSATGTTARAAKTLAEVSGADVYEIRPAIAYTEADLNWSDKQSRSTRESTDANARPELADHDAPIASHDTILLGFPIWWYTAPAIIRSFLEAYDFSGKRIILFATSGGSGLGSTASQLGVICPGATVEDGRTLNGMHASEPSIKKWLGKLGL